jgi:hypothetical protein
METHDCGHSSPLACSSILLLSVSPWLPSLSQPVIVTKNGVLVVVKLAGSVLMLALMESRNVESTETERNPRVYNTDPAVYGPIAYSICCSTLGDKGAA